MKPLSGIYKLAMCRRTKMQGLIALLWIVSVYLVSVAALFFAAGQTALPMFWAYIAVMTMFGLITFVAVYRRIPDMMQEQRRSGEGNQDKATGPTLVALLLVHWIIAGLDVGRYHWSSSVPVTLQIAGLVVSGGGFGLLAWSIITNQFYSPKVDIQSERGQEVITTGPYHFVRHPGYIGWILFGIFSGIALGSWLSILPMLLAATLLVRRTIVEDQMLRRELKGYREYAHQVRYRLVPGLW
jgi:protein-S-isoprenylcysteine O-methyltransferase Ste14